MHLDGAHGCNLAVELYCSATGPDAAIAVVGSEDVLAYWLVISPDPKLLKRAAAHAASIGKAFNGDSPIFTHDDMVEFQNHLGGEQAGIHVLKQRAGDLVTIPPGWAHAVYNKHACVKLAWDW